jgi:hypothetical protein
LRKTLQKKSKKRRERERAGRLVEALPTLSCWRFFCVHFEAMRSFNYSKPDYSHLQGFQLSAVRDSIVAAVAAACDSYLSLWLVISLPLFFILRIIYFLFSSDYLASVACVTLIRIEAFWPSLEQLLTAATESVAAAASTSFTWQ